MCQRATAGSGEEADEGTGREREMWARILGGWLWWCWFSGSVSSFGLVSSSSAAADVSATATHDARVEGEERNSTACETPWTG